ncbi:Gfo/Idh/MocA family protein [Halococcus saccharolyticus]|uniref:Oxidoreductase domain protein n=1 Tax=Halococcus saccharolyticus DSM 5350 TaxID=1227455 RepID=M0MP35_9EURY|nr:Gfo/Idh/MocA family oxidoreductase [Halococcus saccharolyticus]EMA47416.1 oxidoreductase domain protein [Halococcus saccharolyticus DSM 5350]
MSQYTVAIIGTGPDPRNPTVEGFAMGYRHAEAYRNNEDCRLVACADLVPENANAFADAFDLTEDGIYADYEDMLVAVEPDVVSVTVPPAIHEQVVVDCARSGVVDAVHCEKPMALTWPSTERMVQACWRRDVQLTFNRQRRFGRPFTEADRLLDAGEIGALRRIEIGWGDFFDTGAHTVDLAGMFNDDRPAEWVIAQLDYREEDVRFGAHQENQMFAQWRYDNGVHGVLSTGAGASLTDAAIVLRGTNGTLRIDVDDGPMLELERDGRREVIDVDGETMHATADDGDRFGSRFHDRSIGDAIDALRTGEESQLSGRIGLNTAEILFGGYESVRRRGRVDLPLDVDDSPLEAMVESGALSPSEIDDET